MSEVEKPFYNAFEFKSNSREKSKNNYYKFNPVGSYNPEPLPTNCNSYSLTDEEDEPGLDEIKSLLTQSPHYTLLHCNSSTPSPRSVKMMDEIDMIDNTASVSSLPAELQGRSKGTLKSLVKRFPQNGVSSTAIMVSGLTEGGIGGDPAEPYSSSSPFHSANEDFGLENEVDMGRDRFPLIRGPSRQGTFHQFLSSIRIGRGVSKKTEVVAPAAGSKERAGRSSKDRASTSGSGSTEEAEMVAARPSQGSKCSIGILLASISCIFFATSALIVKVSALHPMELLCVRGLLQGIFVLPIVISSKSSILGPKDCQSLLLARAILGSVSLILAFNSIHLIPLADAATVIFTSPVFVSIFACMCLGEICSVFDVCMILLTLVGVLLVSKPSFDFMTTGSWKGLVGTFCGLFAAMLTALAFIILRQLKQVHYSVTVFWFSTVLAAFGAVLTIALDGFTLPDSWLTVFQCLGIGICGFLGQILLTKALQIENAGPVSVARTLDIVLSFFYQITLLHDTPDLYSYLGSCLVVSCVLLTAFSRWFKEVQARRSEKTTSAAVRSHASNAT